jgi:hypothetical protein
MWGNRCAEEHTAFERPLSISYDLGKIMATFFPSVGKMESRLSNPGASGSA